MLRRHWVFAPLLLASACGTSNPPPPTDAPSVDASLDAALDATDEMDVVSVDVPKAPVDSGPACPAPLGQPAPRTVTAPARPMDATLRMNHLQSLATHNSYHLRPERLGPDWDYEHAPLDTQLNDQGVRGLELDIRWDARCGRFRVYHLPILDPRSTCDLFTDCLGLIRRWSDAHAGHHPLFIQLEPKDAWDDATAETRFAAVEAEILSVFPREMVITPDEVRGSSATLPEALRDHGWPTLAASRGRVLFAVDRHDNVREVYTHGGRDLAGRLMFIDANVGAPYAAFLVLNNARSPEVPAAVRAGYIVRVFSWTAGSDPLDPAEHQAALDSGAQVISTDFPGSLPDGGVGARIPGGAPSRCNPLVAPTGCTSEDIERLP
ncbi:MAG: Ca2+-dependent phosphoinositide-specific phospholipase C [Polyangiales bacterium]